MKFLGVTILQGVEFPILLLIFAWALQQCSATALPVIRTTQWSVKNRTLHNRWQLRQIWTNFHNFCTVM